MKILESFPHARGARCSGQAGKSVSIACYADKPILFLFVILALKRVVFMIINYLYHLLHLILKMPALCLDACSQTTSPLQHCMFNNSVIKCLPLLHQYTSQMRNITYACLIHP